MNIINACATELAKNATTDPMLALSAFPKSKSCTNSTMSTAIKGTMIIPNGGMTKHPTRVNPHDSEVMLSRILKRLLEAENEGTLALEFFEHNKSTC